MITLQTTEHLAGVTVTGSLSELNALYDALSNVIGQEGCYVGYDACRLRVLGLCYEIRHAYQGDRHTGKDEFAETVFSFDYYWPEMIFLYASLEEFCFLSAGKQCYLLQEDSNAIFSHEETRQMLLNRLPDDIVLVTYFRALIRNALQRIIDGKRFAKIFRAYDNGYSYTYRRQTFCDYCRQWVDIQNVNFLKRTPDRRKTYLATIAEKILFDSSDYQWLKEDLLGFEQELGEPRDEIELEGMQYPDKIDW